MTEVKEEQVEEIPEDAKICTIKNCTKCRFIGKHLFTLEENEEGELVWKPGSSTGCPRIEVKVNSREKRKIEEGDLIPSARSEDRYYVEKEKRKLKGPTYLKD